MLTPNRSCRPEEGEKGEEEEERRGKERGEEEKGEEDERGRDNTEAALMGVASGSSCHNLDAHASWII